MPIPLLWLGVGATAIYAGLKYASESNESDLSDGRNSFDTYCNPVNGSVLYCGVFGLFEHTGIYVDGNIIELKGNGLIRSISPQRFLGERSGNCIYVACDENKQPLFLEGTAQRALNSVYQYREYDVIKNNCHKFVWSCVSGEEEVLMRFSALNEKLASLFATKIVWNKIKIDKYLF